MVESTGKTKIYQFRNEPEGKGNCEDGFSFTFIRVGQEGRRIQANTPIKADRSSQLI